MHTPSHPLQLATQPLTTTHHPGMATPLAMCMAEPHPIMRPTPLMEAITTMANTSTNTGAVTSCRPPWGTSSLTITNTVARNERPSSLTA
ncbi:hypothetical protein HaLaN_15211 [Haematococcus lacustris]|uniref:Uncharacterized protein n=1 Tax=Haematococcus lacustris TaxID=44745 RepID=A0A699ZAG6_HAELA|nr:hypothetical protein HaLaN_15211 [Haematococcus lacustris]